MFKKSFLKIAQTIGILVITSGIIFAIDFSLLARNTGEPITKSIWDTLVAQLETNTNSIATNTSKNGTQDTSIADLVAEINTLKTQVSTLEASSGGATKGTLGGIHQRKRDNENRRNYYKVLWDGGGISGQACATGYSHIVTAEVYGSGYRRHSCIKN